MHFWLKILYYAVLTLAFLASFWGYKRKGYALFIPLLALSLAVEVLRPQFPNDAAKYFRLFFSIEYTLLTLIISKFLYSRTKRMIMRSSIFVLVPIFIFIELFLIDQGWLYKFLDVLVGTPFICLWTILYLFDTVKQEEEFEVTRNPMFWISLGNLLFFSGSFFSYGFGSYLTYKQSNLADTVFWIARILNILLYILYFIGFLCLRKIR